MSIKRELRSGIFYTFIFKYAQYAIQVLTSAVLARLLTPEEFGVVAIINVFVFFFLILSTFGLATAVIQKQHLSSQNIYSLFIITIILGIGFSLIFFASAPIISSLYNDNEYIKITRLLSVSMFFHTVNSIPLAILTKEKKFKTIGIVTFWVGLTTGIFAILLALNDFSYYSLVYKSILESFLVFSIYFRLSKIRILGRVSFKIFSDVFSYSAFQLLYNVVDYFSKSLDILIIGKYLGASKLGLYDRAYRLLSTVNGLTLVFSPVLHPVLSSHQKDRGIIFNVFKKVTKYLFLLGLPLSVFLHFSSKEIILILYGEQWFKSIPVFEFLSMIIWIQILYSSTQSFFQVLGKTNYLLLLGLVFLLSIFIAVYTGVFINDSIISVAFYLVFAYVVIFLFAYYLLIIKLFKEKVNGIFKVFYPGIVVASVILISNLGLRQFIPIDNLLISLSVKILISGFSFIISLIILNEMKDLIGLFKSKN
jgi:PST family polysaccharide transporter